MNRKHIARQRHAQLELPVVDCQRAADAALRHARLFLRRLRRLAERDQARSTGLLRQRMKPHDAAAGNDGRQQRRRLIGDQKEDRPLRRLFERFQQAVLRGGVHPFGLRDEDDLRAVLKALDRNGIQHLAHHADADDLLALFRHNGMHVRVRAGEHAPTRAARPAGLLLPPAERGHSAKLRGRALARAARPREQVGMDIAPPRKIALQLADERRLPRKIRKGNHVTP